MLRRMTSLAALVWAMASPVGAQGLGPLTVSAGFPASDWVRPDQPIGLTLSRLPATAEGRLAILVGQTDVTSLFRGAGPQLTYDAATQALPPGETEVVVYLVAPGGGWTEVSRLPLRVLTARGLRTARATPNVTLGVKAQLAEGHTPAGHAPPRATYRDFTLQAGIDTEHARGDTVFKLGASLAGTSHREDALRHAQKGDEAPLVDLGSWNAGLQKGAWLLRAGDVTFGRQEHLARQFQSRGTMVEGRFGRADLALAAMNATQIVGWDNFAGISRPAHRIAAATLGFELLPRPGALRVEVTGIDGSALPEASYNQGLLSDAAHGRGVGGRLEASGLGGRLRVLGGYTWSEYGNPVDPTLAQGTAVVAVRPETRAARFGSVALDVLQNAPVTPARSATLSIRFDHDRVDPLFGSIASRETRADVETSAFGATAAFGEVTLQAGHTRAEDNLGAVASILKTLTRRDTAAASLPLAALRKGATPTPWLPVLAYTFDRTHQFGAGIPVDGDFNASHVPDQWSRVHQGTATWQDGPWSLAYRASRSEQDNRQPGRERADLEALAQGISFALSLDRRLSLGLDVADERATNHETGRRDRLRRYGLNFDWQPVRRLALAGSVSFTDGGDEAETTLSRATELDLTASWLLRLRGPGRGPQARLFVRTAHQRARAEDRTLTIFDHRTAWQLSAGLNLIPFPGVTP